MRNKIVIWGRTPPPIGGVTTCVLNLHRALSALNISNEVVDWRSAKAPISLMRNYRAVHLHNISSVYRLLLPAVFRMLGIGNIIVYFHSGTLPDQIRKPLPRLIATIGFRSAKEIWVTNGHLRDVLNHRFNIDAIVVSPYSRDFGSPHLNKNAVSRIPKSIICFIGYGNPLYGFDVFSELLSDPDLIDYNWTLVTYGDTKANEAIVKSAYQRGCRVLHNIEPKEVTEELLRVEIMLRPTTTDGDSMVVRQALDMGVRVIASNSSPRPSGVETCERTTDAFRSAILKGGEPTYDDRLGEPVINAAVKYLYRDNNAAPRVLQIIPDLNVGGAETMLMHLSMELNRRGLNTTVVSLWPPIHSPIEQKLKDAGINLIHLNKRPGFDIIIFFKLFILIYKLKPQVVHSHRMALRYLLPSSLAFRAVKFIHTVHTDAPSESFLVDRLFFANIFRFGIVEPIGCSRDVGNSLSKLYKRSFHVICNGVPAPRTQTHIYNRTGPLRIICIARFQPIKNHAFLLEALSALSQSDYLFTLHLLGDGPLRRDMEEYVFLNKLDNIFFLGDVPDVNEYLKNSDLNVLTSTYEGNPLSVMESMYQSVPVLAFNVGGLSDMVPNDTGWLLPPNDMDSFIQTLLYLCQNRSEIARAGGAARIYAQTHFSISRMTDQYIEIYQLVVPDVEPSDDAVVF